MTSTPLRAVFDPRSTDGEISNRARKRPARPLRAPIGLAARAGRGYGARSDKEAAMIRTLTVAMLLVTGLGSAQAAAPKKPVGATAPAAADAVRKPDLADFVEGTYEGDVISDARGSSQSGVTVTVKRIGKNIVEVSCDYARIPTVTIPLTQAMTAILAARGNAVFLLDRAKDPKRLDLTIDDASLSVHR
jgi:hypothetical protein